MSLPRYPAYKDSAIDWLGEVPKHWVVGPVKRRFSVCLGKMLQTESSGDTDSLRPYVRAANIQWGGVDATDIKTMWFSSRERQQLLLRRGDLLVSEGGDVGRSSIWRDELAECYLQNSVNLVRSKKGDSTKFLYYWMSTIKSKGYVDVLCNKSTIAHFTAEKVEEVPTPFPPLGEQAAIVAFLDRETAKIDALIAEQDKLIALLAEKRQATISHAVTRGLDPDAPMKDSGVAWLGEVPAHWDVAPLKRFWSVTDCKHVTAEFVDEGFPLASIREVQSRYVSLENAKRTTRHYYEQLIEGGRKPLVGDLLFSRNATVGEVAQVTEEHPPFAMGQDVCLLRKLSDDYSSDYLQAVVRSSVVVEQLKNMMVGSTFKRVNVEEIRSLGVPMPPPAEQLQLAEFINSEAARLSTLTAEAGRAIALLKERRNALIAAAVTGQIDVRAAVAAPQAEEEQAMAA